MLRSSDHVNGDNIADEDPGNTTYLTSNDNCEVLDPQKLCETPQSVADVDHVWPRIKRMHGRRGLLEGLIGMPLDILFEIFGHLDPADVLQLARTTKALRDVLMRRSALSVWRHALANVEGLPDCPSDLAEPQWVALVFVDTLCHYCWKTSTPNIVWINRTRCCKQCTAENFSDNLHYKDLPREIVPTITIKKGAWVRQRYCLRTAATYMKEYANMEGQAREKWCAEKKVEMQTRARHAELCRAWNRTRIAQRSTELERRHASIKQKLTELGWGEELEKMTSTRLSHHHLVRQAKDLTDSSWDEIKPVLVDLMEEIKTERITLAIRNARSQRQHLLSRIYEEYVASQPLHSIIPGFADLVMMDKFKTIIEDTPFEQEVTAAHFQEAMLEVTSLIDVWRHSKDKELLEMMKACTDIGPDAKEPMLNLATTFFLCTSCKAEVQHPRILIHSCTTSLRFSGDVSSQYFVDLGCEPWNFGGKRVSFHQVAYRTSRSILTACGFDPDTITAQNIHSSNPLIECLRCSNEKQGRLVMRWPQAVTHAISHQRCSGMCGEICEEAQEPQMCLALLDKEDLKLAAQLEEATRVSTSNYAALWSCVRCKKKTNLNNLRHHIRLTQNEVTEPVEAEDYVRHLDAPGYSQPVRIKRRPKVICDPATCDGSNCGDAIPCDPPTSDSDGHDDAKCDCGDSGGCSDDSKCDSNSDCGGSRCGSDGGCGGTKCSGDLAW